MIYEIRHKLSVAGATRSVHFVREGEGKAALSLPQHYSDAYILSLQLSEIRQNLEYNMTPGVIFLRMGVDVMGLYSC